MLDQKKNATIREVAECAGVSIATVSRVMNNSRCVNPEMRQKVLEAIHKLEYYQNTIARSLKTKSTLTIGFVTADISNPYMIAVAKTIEDLIYVDKYSLLFCSTENNCDRELTYLKVMMGRNIDGLVLNGTGLNSKFICDISKRIPVILLHRRYETPECSSDLVDSDNEDGVYGLTKQLVTFGHRSIYVVKGNKNTSSNTERFRGFCIAMREIGVEVNDSYPFQFDGDFTMQSGYRAVEHIKSMKKRPTAIVCLNNTMTIGALMGLRAMNINVPEDISICGFNNIDNKELMALRPTVYDVNPREVGLHVGKALLERLGEHDIPNRDIIVKGNLVVGNTVSTPTYALDKKIF